MHKTTANYGILLCIKPCISKIISVPFEIKKYQLKVWNQLLIQVSFFVLMIIDYAIVQAKTV